MNLRWVRRVFALCGLIVLVIFSHASLLGAQTASYNLKPPSTVITAKAGDTKSLNIELENKIDQRLDFTVTFENFTSNNESGSPTIISDGKYENGIRSWLSGPKALTLRGGETKNHQLTVKVPKNTPSGTYYGLALYAEEKNPKASAVGSLIFVNVGPVTEKLSLESFINERVNYSAGGSTAYQFTVRLKNSGTGYTVPEQKLTILAEDGKVVKEIVGEEGGVLPDSIRKYSFEYTTAGLDLTQTYTARYKASTPGGSEVLGELEFYTPPTKGTAANTENKPILLPVLMLLLGFVVVVVLLLRMRVRGYYLHRQSPSLKDPQMSKHPEKKHPEHLLIKPGDEAKVEADSHEDHILKPD